MLFLFGAIFIGISPAAATSYDVEIIISGLTDSDLTAFDLDVSYDYTALTFEGYSLTDELGSITDGDAYDDSYGDDGLGTLNLVLTSILDDFSTQSDTFVLATITFSGDVAALAGVSISYVELVDYDFNTISSDCIGISVNPVPEPGTMCLMGLGTLLFGVAGWRRRKANRMN